jgi:flagellar basal-body rod protein FlgF
MDTAVYAALSRQSGLYHEMQVVANNVANAATTGYRAEGMIFSEYIKALEDAPSLSMGQGNVRNTSFAQGSLTQTGGAFDLAIEGDAFFLVQTPAGERLTRAGSFIPGPQGDLVTPDGYPVLDAGGAPLFIPPGADVSVAADGTISASGAPLGQIGLVRPLDPAAMVREDGVMFRADAGTEPSDSARVLQGFVESSNVNPIGELARMIEVQRAYELGQSFLDREDERVRAAVKSLTS